jgi:hypothetical protein
MEPDLSTGSFKYIEDEDSYSEDYDDELAIINNYVQTPFGLYTVDDKMNPMKQYHFFVAHTNFNIDDRTRDQVNEVKGVEALRVLSRYRMMIAFGKSFNVATMKKRIERAVLTHNDKACLLNRFPSIKNKLKDLVNQCIPYDKWIIYVFPNGNMAYTHSDAENFEELYDLLETCEDMSGGLLLTNDNK